MCEITRPSVFFLLLSTRTLFCSVYNALYTKMLICDKLLKHQILKTLTFMGRLLYVIVCRYLLYCFNECKDLQWLAHCLCHAVACSANIQSVKWINRVYDFSMYSMKSYSRYSLRIISFYAVVCLTCMNSPTIPFTRVNLYLPPAAWHWLSGGGSWSVKVVRAWTQPFWAQSPFWFGSRGEENCGLQLWL